MNELLSILEAVEVVAETTGRRFHPATVGQWCTRGVRGAVLNSRIVGGRRFVTGRAAVENFLRELNADKASKSAEGVAA